MYQRIYNAEETAKTFVISQRQVYRIVKQYREAGSVEVRTNQRGRKPKLSQEEIQQVNATLQTNA